MNRWMLSRSLTMSGSFCVGLGVLLLMIKLLMTVAWYASGAIALAGIIMLMAGYLLRGGFGR